MKKLLLTGAAGFVAGNIIRQSRGRLEIHGLDLKPPDYRQDGLLWHAVDLLRAEDLKRLFSTVNPDVVVHTAAASDIDYCEANPEVARRLNSGVTRTLVELCAGSGCRLICFSSDSVFDGKRGNYSEDEEPQPVNVYGRTKVACENLVSASLSDWVVVRPSLVMGFPVLGAGNSFLWRMLSELKQGREVAFPREEIRTPVDVITLSRSVLELAESGITGILHLAGSDALSRLEMAKVIARRLGYEEQLVVDKRPLVAGGRAERPRDVSLSNLRAREVLDTPMRGLADGLDLVLTETGAWAP
jgi:dTDP-4-dehydrorhamnose reductase